MRCSKLTMVLRLALAAAALAALAPARAEARALPPVIEPLLPCYVAAQQDERQPVQITAHGFTPYALIDVYVDDVLQPAGTPPAQADVNGDLLGGSIPAPYIPFGVHRFTLRLAEHAAPANAAVTASRVANLSVQQVPASAATGAHVRFRGQGFTRSGWVWAHYVFAGKSRKTVRIARPSGGCGQFSRRVRQFPFKHSPKVGSWTIQFDQQRHYSAKAPVLVRLTIKVNRTIKPKR
jgi:hypothetical protein